MRLGFVGTGAITRAIVTGLCTTSQEPYEVCVSPRNAESSAHLASRFPAIRVGKSNQEVLDRSDMVVLAVRPQIALEVLDTLHFRKDHHVISLIATQSHESLLPKIQPATALTLAAPLPSVAYHRGPTAIFPASPDAAALFGRISVPVEVDRQSEFDALFACTAEMASYFQLLEAITDFLSGKGITPGSAQVYVASLFSALGHTAVERTDQTLAALVADHMTKGGLNEQFRTDLIKAGVFASHIRCLNRVLYRIQSNRKW